VTAIFPASAAEGIWDAGPHGLVATGHEVLDAVGLSYRFTAWWTRDGRRWRRAAHDVHGPLVAYPSGMAVLGVGDERWGARDGRRWRLLGRLALPRRIQLGFISDVARVGDGLVGVGTIYRRDRTDSHRAPGVWRSTDGRTWRPLPPPDAPYESHFDAVAVADESIITVGYGGGGDAGLHGIWTSRDGLDWTRALDPDLEGFLTRDVAVDGSGRIVVVGAAANGSRPAALRSTDGMSWERSPDGPQFGGALAFGHIDDVAALPDGGFVASGAVDGVPGLWHSPDGLDWSRLMLAREAAQTLPEGHLAAFTAIHVRGRELLLAASDPVARRAVFLAGSIEIDGAG
jgi:hypothetical protein